MKKTKDIQPNLEAQFNYDLTSFFGTEILEKAGELYDQIETPIIKGVQLGIPLRNLNHLVYMLGENPENLSRKKYSFVEFIWIKIVEQLRATGVNFSTIASFKSKFLEPIKLIGILSKTEQVLNFIEDLKLPKSEKEQLIKFMASPEYKNTGEVNFTLLHIMVIESLIKKTPLSIALFSDATFLIIDKSKEHFYTEDEKEKLLFETHVVVSISAILKKFFLSRLATFVVPEIKLLSYGENKLFEVIRTGEYDSIIIHFKDKKANSLELIKSEDTHQKIYDILNKGQYGEILIKKHKGIVTKIENNIKVNL